jgi:hypothetical protein
MDFFNKRKSHGNVFNEIRTIQNRFLDLVFRKTFLFAVCSFILKICRTGILWNVLCLALRLLTFFLYNLKLLQENLDMPWTKSKLPWNFLERAWVWYSLSRSRKYNENKCWSNSNPPITEAALKLDSTWEFQPYLPEQLTKQWRILSVGFGKWH